MQRSFTILELIVSIVILGILTTMGVFYLMGAIERSRGAEARIVLKQIREEAAAMCLKKRCSEPFTDAAAGIGLGGYDQIPGPTEGDCNSKYHFWYKIEPGGTAENFTATATRCISGGRSPNAIVARYLKLVTNFSASNDSWESNGGY